MIENHGYDMIRGQYQKGLKRTYIRRVDAIFDDVVEEAVQGCSSQRRAGWSSNTLCVLRNG